MDPMGTYWAIAWLTWAPLRGFLKKVPPRIRMDYHHVPRWQPQNFCFHFTLILFALRMPGTAAQRRYCHSQSRILGVHKNSRLITARQVHAYMVPNMQKNGCVCVYLIVHIYMYMVFGIRRYNYVYIYILYPSIYIYIWVRWQPPQRGIPSCQQGTSPVKPHGYVFCFAKVVFGTPGGKPTSTWNIHLLYIYIYYIYILYIVRFPEMGILIRFSIINISKPSILGYHHGKPHQSTYSLVFDVAKDLHNHPKSRHSTLSVEVCPALPGKISVKIRGLIDIDTRWCPQDS